MNLFRVTKFLLLMTAALNLLYSYLSSLGTACLNQFSAGIALFSIFYTVVMLFFEE